MFKNKKYENRCFLILYVVNICFYSRGTCGQYVKGSLNGPGVTEASAASPHWAHVLTDTTQMTSLWNCAKSRSIKYASVARLETGLIAQLHTTTDRWSKSTTSAQMRWRVRRLELPTGVAVWPYLNQGFALFTVRMWSVCVFFFVSDKTLLNLRSLNIGENVAQMFECACDKKKCTCSVHVKHYVWLGS